MRISDWTSDVCVSDLKAMSADGALGDLSGVELRCHCPLIRDGDALFPFVTRPGYTTNYNWLGMAGEGASALRNLGGHCLHAILYLFGEVESVSATLGRGLREWRFDDGSRFTPPPVDHAFATLRVRARGTAQRNRGWSGAG